MSYAALCMLAESRGWVIALAANHNGPDLKAHEEDAYLRTLAIYEDKAQWKASDPLVAVRLDCPIITLDQAAEAITKALTAAGVV